MNEIIVNEIIEREIKEDIFYGDITTETLINNESISKADFIAKEDGVVAGVLVAKKVFNILDNYMKFIPQIQEGDRVLKGDIIATVEGRTRAILSGERTSLNLLQRISGIASRTNEYVEKVKNYDVKIADTRKTIPGIRILDKYAVKIGGGYNHRYNLSDGVLIKDNHIRVVGGIAKSIELARNEIPHTMKIEIEVHTLEELKEAIEAKADIIMLDNMSIENMKKAVNINKNKVILEASGNIDLNNVEKVAATGVDIISVGELTHSVKIMDISLDMR